MSVWRLGKGMSAKEFMSNFLMFQFFHEMDVLTVVEDGLWSFQNCILVLQRTQPNETPYNVPLTHMDL